MKTRNLFLGILLAIGVLLVSCKKDDDGGSPANSSGSISLVVDGSSWSATLAVQGVNSNGVINVTGSDSNAEQAGVTLVGVTETGTYTISMGSPHQLRWTEGLGQDQTYVASGVVGSGTITITELSDSKVKGTFSFTGYNTDGNTKEITDGQFEGNF